MPAWLMVWVEAICAAIARGVTRGILDAMQAPVIGTEEKPNADDQKRANLFRATVAAAQRLQPVASGQSVTGPNGSPRSQPAGNPDPLGPAN